MKTFMLDSMIFDRIIENEELKKKILELKNCGQIKILVTHIQIDQLNNTPDTKKREKLLECAKEICENVPTSGGVWGTSRWGDFKWGSKGDHEVIEGIRRGNLRHTSDALIAATAKSDADVLVTGETKTLPSRFKKEVPSKEVWNYKQFQKYIESL